MSVNFDFESLFDLLVHMGDRETAGSTYAMGDGTKLTPESQGKVLHKSIQSFMQRSGKIDGNRVIQAFSGSSDLPQLTKDSFNAVNLVPEYDTLWQKVFKGISLKKGQLSWEIADVAAGLTFSLVPEGGKATIYGVSGSKVTANIEKYGAGLGVTWEMIEGRKLYQFIDQMEKVKGELNKLWANIHYKLLADAGAKNKLAYQQGTGTIDRDIKTLNTAYVNVGKKNKDKNYANIASAPMELYYAPSLHARLMAAFRTTNSDLSRSGIGDSSAVEFKINPNLTWNSAIPAGKALLVLPGNKIQNAMYTQELGLKERNIRTLSDVQTYWSAFGAIVADSDQVSELSFS